MLPEAVTTASMTCCYGNYQAKEKDTNLDEWMDMANGGQRWFATRETFT